MSQFHNSSSDSLFRIIANFIYGSFSIKGEDLDLFKMKPFTKRHGRKQAEICLFGLTGSGKIIKSSPFLAPAMPYF